jgi:hypothetical protein
MTISSWLKGQPEQLPNSINTTNSADLANRKNLTLTKADAEEIMVKYQQLRKQVDEDEIYNALRAEIASLRNRKAEYDIKLRDADNAKLSAEMQLFTVELHLKDVRIYYKAEIKDRDAQNKELEQENESLRRNEQYMRFLLLSHGVRLPEQFTPPEYMQAPAPESLPELTDDNDTDEADELDEVETGDGAIVCPQWYNHGRCSRSGGASCKLGAHPRLVDFSTLVRQ